MEVPSLEPDSEIETDCGPLLAGMNNQNDQVHVIDILRGRTVPHVTDNDILHGMSSSGSEENRYSGRAQAMGNNAHLSTSGRLNTRNSSFIRRSDQYGQRNRSPLNSGLWISVELVVTMSQIIASVVVLSLSRHENPQAPLFAWVVGYASGCVATIPILYWRFRNRNQGLAQDSDQPHRTNLNDHAYGSALPMHTTEEGNRNNMAATSINSGAVRSVHFRLNGVMDHFKMALDCFFAVWFVVGNVWIFGGHTSPSDAPKLYRLCIVFLTFSCIGYAMPFILCATICCCLPCVISLLGFREEFSQNRGATADIINTFPVHKFKLKKNVNFVDPESNSGSGEGGVLAAGTENERPISGEDAVCCICLGKYGDGDELRELSCLHFFHVECVDKWLKISAICPLCKSHVGGGQDHSPPSHHLPS